VPVAEWCVEELQKKSLNNFHPECSSICVTCGRPEWMTICRNGKIKIRTPIFPGLKFPLLTPH
jgi:hypothetical protein